MIVNDDGRSAEAGRLAPPACGFAKDGSRPSRKDEPCQG